MNDTDLLPLRSRERFEELPISATKLYQLINAGKIPAVKLGRKTFLRRGDLRAFKENLPRYGAA